MKITFCMPTPNYRNPIGGFKMVYEYANRLSRKGHIVNIVYCTERTLYRLHLPNILRLFLAKIIVKKSPRWFPLDKCVNRIAAPKLIDDYIPDADCVIATAAQTAECINNLNKSKGKKCYFIQDYENWLITDKELIATYEMGMTNMVVSNWLYKIVHDVAPSNTICISNPIDTNRYRIIIKNKDRNKYCIGMLYHDAEYKGCKYALEAVSNLKLKYPEIELYMFGNPSFPDKYKQEWIHYTQHASAEQTIEIYNKCSVFVCASVEEGFGLTGLESMACGCALVSTAYRGVFEYADDNLNALLCPIKNVQTLSDNVERVLLDDDLREYLSSNGRKKALDFSWDGALSAFEKAIS